MRDYERHARPAEADLAASQDAFASEGGAQRSGSGGGGGQPARSGGPGTSVSGPGRPPRQPTPGGGSAPMRAGPAGPPMRPGPMAAGPGMGARPAVPLVVLQPEQLQRADTGALFLPAQISNLLSAGSIQVRHELLYITALFDTTSVIPVCFGILCSILVILIQTWT